MRLPGKLRQGFIKEINGTSGTITLTDGKGGYKQVVFDLAGRAQLKIGREDEHLLLCKNGHANEIANKVPVEKSDKVICLVSNGRHPPKAHRWATVKDHKAKLDTWQEIRLGKKMKTEFQTKVLRFRDYETPD